MSCAVSVMILASSPISAYGSLCLARGENGVAVAGQHQQRRRPHASGTGHAEGHHVEVGEERLVLQPREVARLVVYGIAGREEQRAVETMG
jgi:hypothetical protein